MDGHKKQSQHYAADRDYTDFVGTKDASGFALDDGDDIHHAYNSGGRGDRTGDSGEYTMEIHSPVASDDEENCHDNGLFRDEMTTEKRMGSEKQQMSVSRNVSGIVDNAWSAWGLSSNVATGGARTTTTTTTVDGKPVLSGFSLGRRNIVGTPDTPKRWVGPIPSTGYVLKRHVFDATIVDNNAVIGDSTTEGLDDCGLGLNLQKRRQQHPRSSRSVVPRVLPPSTSVRQPLNESGKLFARDGTELNFHAVKESMKNRFVSSTTGTTTDPPPPVTNNDSKPLLQDLDATEFVEVTSATWVPTRLLCKRWGVPVPTTVEMSGGGAMKDTEVDYFRRTIYEPAMANRQKDGNATRTTNTYDRVVSTMDGGRMVSSAMDDKVSDTVGPPPPTRPSAEVFRYIFDVESDMDISSSDDDESREKTDRAPMKVEGEECLNVNNTHLSNSVVARTSCVSDSLNSRQSAKRRREDHRDYHRSRDDSDYDNEWVRKTRKERHRRHDFSDQSDGEESSGHASYNEKKRRKKKQFSRPRHGKC